MTCEYVEIPRKFDRITILFEVGLHPYISNLNFDYGYNHVYNIVYHLQSHTIQYTTTDLQRERVSAVRARATSAHDANIKRTRLPTYKGVYGIMSYVETANFISNLKCLLQKRYSFKAI